MLITKDLRKFVKLFTFVKIRTDIRAMDLQVKEYGVTQPAKAVEGQIIICCKSLQHMVHFPKYTNVQIHVRRSLALLTHLLFHTKDVIRPELRDKVLLPVIKMIQYNKLGRSNKQIVNSLLEMCK